MVLFLHAENVSLVCATSSHKKHSHTFQVSNSDCLDLYCFSISSRTCFSPSELVFSVGRTSWIVRSTKTPFTMRKHLRSVGRGSRVSMTSLLIKCECQRRSIGCGTGTVLRNNAYSTVYRKGRSHLCSSASCSISPIFCASCWSVFLKLVYWS